MFRLNKTLSGLVIIIIAFIIILAKGESEEVENYSGNSGGLWWLSFKTQIAISVSVVLYN